MQRKLYIYLLIVLFSFQIVVQSCDAIDAGDINSVIVKGSWKNDPAHKLATDGLTSFMKSVYGKNVDVVSDTSISAIPNNALIIGDKGNTWINKLVKNGALSMPSLKKDGFIIKSVNYGGKNLIIISGNGILGNVYGIFYFTERFRLDHDKSDWNIRREPEFPIRVCHGTVSIEFCLQMGGNYKEAGGCNWFTALDYNGYENGKYIPSANPCNFNSRNINEVKKYHIKTYSHGDVFTVPDSMPTSSGKLTDEKWEMLDYQIRKFFASYPVDIAQVSYARHVPINNPPDGFKTESVNWRSYRDLGKMTAILSKAARDYNRHILIRTWDDMGEVIGNPGHWHTDIQKHHDIVEEARRLGADMDKVIFQFKYTPGDFMRYQEYNPVVASRIGNFLVKWQVGGREYGGFGILPYYQGMIFAEGNYEKLPKAGMKKMKEDGTIGVGSIAEKGVWDRSSDYAFAHLWWDVDSDPRVLAKEWAALELGVEYDSPLAQTLASAVIDSPEINLKTLYIKEHNIHSEKYGDLMVFTHRNYLLGKAEQWPYSLDDAFTDLKSSDKVQNAIEEKKEATRMINLFLARIDSLRQNAPAGKDDFVNKMYASALQYKYLVYTVRYYVSGMLAYWNGDNSKAREYLRDWKISWDFYENQIKGPDYNPERDSYHPPKLIGADFGAENKKGEHPWSYKNLYADGEDKPGSMTRDIENIAHMKNNFYRGIYPERLLHFSKFSDDMSFEAYVGVPYRALANRNYLIVADITNVDGFMGDGNAQISNIKLDIKTDGKQAGTVLFSNNPISSHDVPLLMATNWNSNDGGIVTSTIEFDYDGNHYILSGIEPLPSESCQCSQWIDQGCGHGSCEGDEMFQVRTCTNTGCDSESRCVSDKSCENADDKTSISYELNLTKGWNIIFIPTEDHVDIPSLGVCGKINAYVLNGRRLKAVDAFVSGKSYIVRMRKNCTLNLTGSMLSARQVEIKQWWNIVGFRRGILYEEITAVCGKCLILSFKDRIFRLIRPGEYLKENKAYLIRSQKNCIMT